LGYVRIVDNIQYGLIQTLWPFFFILSNSVNPLFQLRNNLSVVMFEIISDGYALYRRLLENLPNQT